MGFFQRLFGGARKRSEKPAVLRIVSDRVAGSLQSVEVEATWFPSKAQTKRTLLAESGLCILPWRSGQQRVAILARVGTHVGHVELSVSDCATDLAHEVALVQA
jgi:hypothetical protein